MPLAYQADARAAAPVSQKFRETGHDSLETPTSDSSFTDKLSRTPTRRRQRMLGSATVARRFFAVFMAG
jgi:hypothetical protein